MTTKIGKIAIGGVLLGVASYFWKIGLIVLVVCT